MRDKLVELIKRGGVIIPETADAVADYLIAKNVVVLPEKMKDSWELALPFMMRLFATDEEYIEKVHREFERKEVKQILTDIRDYLAERKAECGNEKCEINQIMGLGVKVFVYKALADLTEYAEKLGVEL
jgi:molybdopterin converting factor small subunit